MIIEIVNYKAGCNLEFGMNCNHGGNVGDF
jgi:hypothetical protein